MPHFVYDIFGVPYYGHIRPEHYDFLHQLPAGAINAAMEEVIERANLQMNSIEGEYERCEDNATD